MEYWSAGVTKAGMMEYWNDGIMGKPPAYATAP
jgi:hypothetical protein